MRSILSITGIVLVALRSRLVLIIEILSWTGVVPISLTSIERRHQMISG